MHTERVRLILAAVVIMAILDLGMAIYAVLEAPIPVRVSLGTPMAYKNIYLHVPIAISTYIVLTGALISSILYLWRGMEKYSRLADSYVKYGLLFGAATLVTGSSWASESWGAAWNWDPKQTAVLFLFLAYLAYFPLKGSINDPDRANRVGAAYAIAAFTMVPMSFLASRVMDSLHPTGEAIAEFAGGGSGGVILGIRILILSTLGILMPLLHATGGASVPTAIPIAILAVGVVAAGYIAYPTLTGENVRVVDAVVDNGLLKSITLSNGETVTFDSLVEPPVKPAVTSDGQSTLIGHIVEVGEGGVKVLYHWSTPFTLIVYTILLSLGLYILGARRWVGQY